MVTAIIAGALFLCIYTGTHVLVGRLLGLRPLEVTIGMGPSLLAFEAAQTKYSLKALPLNGSVQFEEEAFGTIPRVPFVLFVLSGSLTAAALAAVLIADPKEVWDWVSSGLYQPFLLLVSPHNAGFSLVQDAVQFIQTEPLHRTFGFVWSKLAAFNTLLQIPFFVGAALPSRQPPTALLAATVLLGALTVIVFLVVLWFAI